MRGIVPRLRVLGRGSAGVRRQGLPPRRQERVRQEREADFPVPKGLFTIEDLGGWDKVATDFFDPDDRLGRRDREGTGSRDPVTPRRLQAPKPLRGGSPGSASGRGSVPHARARRSPTSASWSCCRSRRWSTARRCSDGSGNFWDADDQSAGRRGAEADVISAVIVAAINAFFGDDHRLGPGPRRVPRQEDRQLADRSALRAADDRRRPDAAGALRRQRRAQRPDRVHRRRLHPDRRRHGADVRHPPLRRSRRAAGAVSSSISTWRKPPPRSGPAR